MKPIIKHIHFVGIGGSGMSGIAEVLLNLGYIVSGSDISTSSTIERLIQFGAQVRLTHAAQHIQGADAVVVSSAIGSENPEVMAARKRKIPVVPRAKMLAELMRLKQGIAVAGTHGKTTTTSLIASVLAEGAYDPTFVIGGRLNQIGANAQLGSGDFMVVEADESDISLLDLSPVIEVITNIDADHMSAYGYDIARLKRIFIEFTQLLPFYGMVVLCVDDLGTREILPLISRPVITYGCSEYAREQAQLYADNIRAVGAQMQCTVYRRPWGRHHALANLAPLELTLNLPGQHNVCNALATIAVATELEIADKSILQALAQFRGVGRRFQSYNTLPCRTGGRFTLIDDYAHHPVEIQATLAAARGAFPGKDLVLVFQPHRYTRTQECFEGFVHALSQADKLVLTEIYAAGESKVLIQGKTLVDAVQKLGKEVVFVKEIKDLPQTILHIVRDQDVVMMMGAGSIGRIPQQLIQLVEAEND